MNKKWLLLSSSVGMLLLASYVPVYCDWLIFVFLVPLFYGIVKNPHDYSFKEGLYWGIIFFTAHWLGLFYVIIEHAQGEVRFLLIPLLIIYGALHAALWFWIAHACLHYTTKHYIILGWWAVVTLFYFWWVRYGIFWIFGYFCGDGFSFPLISLAGGSAWLALLWLFGSQGLMACLVASAICCAYAVQGNLRWLAPAGGMLLPFMYGFIGAQQNPCWPACCAKMGYVTPSSIEAHHPLDRAQRINELCDELIAQRPEITIIVMPESAYPYCLDEQSPLWVLLQDKEDTMIIIGAHRIEGDKKYNSLFMMKGSSITTAYDKKILMPFTEHIYWPWKHLSCFSSLFLKNTKEFIPQENSGCFCLLDRDEVYPLLCSDFFLARTLDGLDRPLLCLVNEHWFSLSTVHEWMYLYARYTAQELQRDIIYVSHYYAVFISKTGTFKKIARE